MLLLLISKLRYKDSIRQMALPTLSKIYAQAHKILK